MPLHQIRILGPECILRPTYHLSTFLHAEISLDFLDRDLKNSAFHLQSTVPLHNGFLTL